MNKKQSIELSQLLLDPQNPRFVKNIAETKRRDLPLQTIQRLQSSIREKIRKTPRYDILKSSILVHGYVDLDPIIVKQIKGSPYYLVIEGNRRICAIKDILENKDDLLAVEKDPTKIKSLKSINCIVHSSDSLASLNQLLGIRHVIGVQNWDQLQIALMIASLYQELKDSQLVADAFGEKVSRVNKFLRVVALYTWVIENTEYGEQIKRDATIDIFMTAMTSKNVKNWFGFIENIEDRLSPRFSNPENVEKFAEWIAKKKIKTGRFDVTALNKILATDNAEYYLAKLDDDGVTPQLLLGEITSSHQSGKWKRTLKATINSLNRIELREVENLSKEERELLQQLSELISDILEKHRRLVGV